jgi:hypothetical protein
VKGILYKARAFQMLRSDVSGKMRQVADYHHLHWSLSYVPDAKTKRLVQVRDLGSLRLYALYVPAARPIKIYRHVEAAISAAARKVDAMSVEVDFVQSGQVFQAAGVLNNRWVVSAPWLNSGHFYGVSFVPDSTRSNLQLVSQSFVNDPAGNVSIEAVISNNGEDAVFRVSLIQAPSEF